MFKNSYYLLLLELCLQLYFVEIQRDSKSINWSIVIAVISFAKLLMNLLLQSSRPDSTKKDEKKKNLKVKCKPEDLTKGSSMVKESSQNTKVCFFWDVFLKNWSHYYIPNQPQNFRNLKSFNVSYDIILIFLFVAVKYHVWAGEHRREIASRWGILLCLHGFIQLVCLTFGFGGGNKLLMFIPLVLLSEVLERIDQLKSMIEEVLDNQKTIINLRTTSTPQSAPEKKCKTQHLEFYITEHGEVCILSL